MCLHAETNGAPQPKTRCVFHWRTSGDWHLKPLNGLDKHETAYLSHSLPGIYFQLLKSITVCTNVSLSEVWGFSSIDQADLYCAVGIIKQKEFMMVWKQNVIQSSQLQRIFLIWGISTVTKLKFPSGPSEAAASSWWNALSVDVVKAMDMFRTPSVFSLLETSGRWEFSRVCCNCCFMFHMMYISTETSTLEPSGKRGATVGIIQIFSIVKSCSDNNVLPKHT